MRPTPPPLTNRTAATQTTATRRRHPGPNDRAAWTAAADSPTTARATIGNMKRTPIWTWRVEAEQQQRQADSAAQFHSERGRKINSRAGASSSDSLSLMLSATGKIVPEIVADWFGREDRRRPRGGCASPDGRSPLRRWGRRGRAQRTRPVRGAAESVRQLLRPGQAGRLRLPVAAAVGEHQRQADKHDLREVAAERAAPGAAAAPPTTASSLRGVSPRLARISSR